MKLTPEYIQGFTASLLSPRFDVPLPTPEFHLKLWEFCCLDDKFVAIASPRGTAKSTAITHAYGLAEALFRESPYTLIVSDTEGQATEFLGDIKMELEENFRLREEFGVHKFVKESQTDLIVQMHDGYCFRFLAKGAEQKIRGRKWRGTRPTRILCHAKGTLVYADGSLIKVEDHPTAKEYIADGIEVVVGDVSEKVSADHRYWCKRTENSTPEWVEAKDLREGMLIGEL
jgi:hypothetical protein